MCEDEGGESGRGSALRADVARKIERPRIFCGRPRHPPTIPQAGGAEEEHVWSSESTLRGC